MPEKSQTRRARDARRKGEAMTIKDSDIGRVGARMGHAVKKSRGVAGKASPPERNASPKAPPGTGRTRGSRKLPMPGAVGSTASRRKTLPAEAAAGYRKDERRKTPRNEAGARRMIESLRRSSVRGRKKSPSQMNVHRKGGPFKHTRTHGA